MGKRQERIPCYGRILHLCHRRHARRKAVNEYIALPQQEAFDIEYWSLEEAKLRRMPPEKELARQIVAVVGSGSGIGKESHSDWLTKVLTLSAWT